MENEALKAKLPTMLQSNDPPDIFTSWGGGVMLDHDECRVPRRYLVGKGQHAQDRCPVCGGGVPGRWQAGRPCDRSQPGVDLRQQAAARKRRRVARRPEDMGWLQGRRGQAEGGRALPRCLPAAATSGRCSSISAICCCAKVAADAIDKLKAEGFMGPEFLKAAQDLIDLGKLEPFQDGWLGKPGRIRRASSATSSAPCT